MAGSIRRRGFSLMEIILSFFVVCIVLIVLTNVYPMSYVSLKRGQNIMQADALAQDVLEQARAKSYRGLVVGNVQDTVVPKEGITFRIRRTVHAVPGVDDSLLREVVVRVEWEELGRLRHTTHRLYLPHVQR